MADDHNETNRLKVELAELKGTILTEIRHLSHDIKNLIQGMVNFVPRQELKQMHDRMEEKADTASKDNADRIKKIEESLTWAWRTVVAAWIGGFVTWVLAWILLWPKK